MLRRTQRVLGENERRVRRENLFRELLHRCRALGIASDIADVDRGHAVWEFAHDLTVDLRIVLARVADENELEVGIQRHDAPDSDALMPEMTRRRKRAPSNVPVAQDDRSFRDLLKIHEL